MARVLGEFCYKQCFEQVFPCVSYDDKLGIGCPIVKKSSWFQRSFMFALHLRESIFNYRICFKWLVSTYQFAKGAS